MPSRQRRFQPLHMPALDRVNSRRLSQIAAQNEAQRRRPPLGIDRWHKFIRLINNDTLHRSVGSKFPQPVQPYRAAIAYPPTSSSAQRSRVNATCGVDRLQGLRLANAVMAKKEIKPRRLAAAEDAEKWREAFVRYLRSECHLAENSVVAYERDLRRFFEWLRGRRIA